MVLRFAYSNFRSFKGEHELSLIASPMQDLPEASFPLPGGKEHVLPVCAIYGGNASGKTTVLRAFAFMDKAVRDSHRLWEADAGVPLEPFGISKDPSSSSQFVLDFVSSNVRYQYGFSADRTRILGEWLTSYPNGRKLVLFNRKPEGAMSFGRHLPGDNKTIERLTRPNSLFLSAAAQNNHEILLPLYRWFNSLQFVFDARQQSTSRAAEMCANEQDRNTLVTLLRSADLGLADIQHEIVEPDPEVKDMATRLVRAMQDAGLPLSVPSPFTAPQPSIKLIHQLGDKAMPFPITEESNGTLAYLGLLPAIVGALREGSTLLVDELDSSLHPLLCINVVRMFNDPKTNTKSAQLIFNTHDANLLSRGILRRDQVWFTEKDSTGQSHLYPLTDFKPRKDENLESGYLQGRYGAIPFLASEPFIVESDINAQIR